MSRVPYIRGDDLRRLEVHLDKTGLLHPTLGTPCWVWLGDTVGGYGRVRVQGRNILAHRWAWELLVGPCPEELQPDHLCSNPSCCNPEHLDWVTSRENIMRSSGLCAVNAVKTHCPKGHPYDDLNTYHRPDGGRDCRVCINRRSRERNERCRARRSAPR